MFYLEILLINLSLIMFFFCTDIIWFVIWVLIFTCSISIFIGSFIKLWLGFLIIMVYFCTFSKNPSLFFLKISYILPIFIIYISPFSKKMKFKFIRGYSFDKSIIIYRYYDSGLIIFLILVLLLCLWILKKLMRLVIGSLRIFF